MFFCTKDLSFFKSYNRYSLCKAFLLTIINDKIDDIKDAINLFDEEHKIIFNSYVKKYQNWYNDIYTLCEEEYRDDFETQKDAAMYFKNCTYPAVLFGMRNGKNVDKIIWRIIDKER